MKVTSTKKNLFAFKAGKVISWCLIYGDDLCFELLFVCGVFNKNLDIFLKLKKSYIEKGICVLYFFGQKK